MSAPLPQFARLKKEAKAGEKEKRQKPNFQSTSKNAYRDFLLVQHAPLLDSLRMSLITGFRLKWPQFQARMNKWGVRDADLILDLQYLPFDEFLANF